MTLVIDNEKCAKGKTCTDCVDVCPVQALTKDGVIKVDEEKCIMCGACAAICKEGAITIE